MAVASVFSQMRAIGVPLGMEDPDHPNISSTLWRTVADHDDRRYYFETAVRPSVIWVDLAELDFSPHAPAQRSMGAADVGSLISSVARPAAARPAGRGAGRPTGTGTYGVLKMNSPEARSEPRT